MRKMIYIVLCLLLIVAAASFSIDKFQFEETLKLLTPTIEEVTVNDDHIYVKEDLNYRYENYSYKISYFFESFAFYIKEFNFDFENSPYEYIVYDTNSSKIIIEKEDILDYIKEMDRKVKNSIIQQQIK